MSAYRSTILVTGGTLGLGYWATYELACKNPQSKILVASRSDKNSAANSLNKLVARNQNTSAKSDVPQIEFRSLDLASNSNVRAFVKTFTSEGHPPISHLLLNAGIQFRQGKDYRRSADGVEATFAVNHVGHALLFFLLKPHLAHDARIVVVSSGTHDPAKKTSMPDPVYESAELLAHPTDKEGYEINMRGPQRYTSSKLANMLFTYALERRLKKARELGTTNWTVCAFDPGLMPGTGLARDMGPVVMFLAMHVLPHLTWLLRIVFKTDNVHLPQESGKNLAMAASESGKAAMERSGVYYEGAKVIPSSEDSHVDAKQEDLWRWTIDFVAEDETEKKRFETF